MLRRKLGRDYAVVVGGKLEGSETLEECALREMQEETGLVGPIVRRLPDIEDFWRTAFLVSTQGEPCLGGPEARRSNPWNQYRPAWVPLDELDSVGLQPPEAVDTIRRAWQEDA